MINADKRTMRLLKTIPNLDSKVGILVAQNGPIATVNIGPNTVQVPYVGQVPGQIGKGVQLERINDELKATGPSSPIGTAGVVTATGVPKLTVEIDGISYLLPYDPDAYMVPATGDDVSINWFYPGGIVSGKVSTTPVVVPPPTGGGSGTSSGRQQFTALSSGSFAPGAISSDDVIYGESYASAGWFYGSKIRDTIPDSAPITAFRIYLNCRVASGSELQLGVHGLDSKPASAFTVSSKITIPGVTAGFQGWVDLGPLGAGFWAEFLRSNVGGIGTNGPGYRVLRGVSADGMSGALDISWG